MLAEVINQWDANKEHLEDIISNTNMKDISYGWLMEKILLEVLNRGENGMELNEELFMAECGSYQGSNVFLFSRFNECKAYNIFVTVVNYGSCSGCDTIENIRRYKEELPNREQVRQFMTLCLHLVQRIKPLYSVDEEQKFDYTGEELWI